MLALGAATIALVGGCSSQSRPDKMAQAARDAMKQGETPRAIALTEAAVQADGRNASLRLMLANAYLHAGRFESARMAYADAIELGDDSSRAALGLVLADLALGHNAAALDTLNTYGDVLPAADYGLALVMAGQNQRGIDTLTDTIRQGHNLPKVRQNLAYAYALSGMWTEARIMAGQDVPADQVDARLQSWAALTRPEDGRRRVATLLGSPLVSDAGQPEALALSHFPGSPAPGAEPAKPAPVVQAAATELPAAQTASGALARIDLPQARPAAALPFSAPAPAPAPAPAAIPAPSVHRVVPLRQAQAQTPNHAPAVHGYGTHLVQIGAYNSADAARRAWLHFAARNPALGGHPNMITKVNVHGHDYWRLQAAGFAGHASASSVCGTLRAHGGACFVLAVSAAAQVNPVQTAAVAHPVIKPAASPVRPVATHPAPTHPGTATRAK
jgi:Flp pilus assembly protein TadD